MRLPDAPQWAVGNVFYTVYSLRLIILTFALALGFNASAAGPSPRGQETYTKQVLPLLQQFCYDCHGDGAKKGKFALDEHKDYTSMLADQKYWDHVRQMLYTHVMPPTGKDSPTLEQRDLLVKWLDDSVFYYDPAKPDPGHVTMRRLNRAEYDNTIRDTLLLYDQETSAEFPADDAGYGFDNIGDVLTLSPIHLEKYMRAARKLSALATKITAPERASIEVGASKFDHPDQVKLDGDDGVLWLFSEAKSQAGFKVPADGVYRVSFFVAEQKAGPDHAKVKLTLDKTDLGTHEVTKEFKKAKMTWQKIESELPLTQGYHRISLAFVNDFSDSGKDRNVALDKVDVSGPYGLSSPSVSGFLKWLVPDASLGTPAVELSGEDFLPGNAGEDGGRDTGAYYLASNGFAHHPLEVAKAGKYRFTFKLGALQAGNEDVKFQIKLNDRTLLNSRVTKKNQAPEWFTFETEVAPGRFDLQLWFLNDFYDEATKADRNFWIHEAKVSGPIGGKAGLDASQMPAIVAKMGERLFRRPLRAEEQAQWVGIAQQASATGADAMETINLVLEGMLVSPAFLFHSQPQPAGQPLGDTVLIDEYSLATRLSYFLWSAPPDEPLLALAKKGELRQKLPETLRTMIGDWRGTAFTKNFAGQWLQLRDTDLINPNKRLVPEFQGGSIANAFRKETSMFFEHILKGNRSVIEFLNADYTFADHKLGKFYGLAKAPKGKEFEKVSLAGTPRGGVLTQGSVLAITSNPTRTSIVKRGKFILENILGTPPPPVPGDVPPLDEKAAFFGHQTLRQQFEAHRKDAGCAGCHAFLDPMGFAMENYDLVGRWRDQDHKQPVDAAGQLVRGQKFKDLSELRELLVRDMKHDFVRCLAENLLTYALGRGPIYADRAAIAEIVRRTEASGYKFQDMILAVCESVPFQRMRKE